MKADILLHHTVEGFRITLNMHTPVYMVDNQWLPHLHPMSYHRTPLHRKRNRVVVLASMLGSMKVGPWVRWMVVTWAVLRAGQMVAMKALMLAFPKVSSTE
jgi:hypothetical protein